MSQTAPSLESNVRLPRAVRERSARIAQMLEPQANPGVADPTPPANEPAIESAAPSPEPAPPAAPVAPTDPRENDPQYWAQRFRVTQGMLDRERRERIADQERTQRDLTELREQLRTTQQQAPTPSKIDVSQFFTPEQIEQYGQEQCETLASVALKAAQEESQRALNDRLKPLEDQRKQDAENAAKQRQDAFWTALAAAVPDFETIDASDAWKAWLSEDDPTTGLMRDRVLKQHLAAWDAPKVARIFAAYKASLVAPPAPPVSAGNRAGPPAEPQASNRPTKGYPTPAEIKDFYKRAATVRRGQPGFVTDQERSDFEARMQLQRPAA